MSVMYRGGIAAVAAAAVLALSGCGSDSGDDGEAAAPVSSEPVVEETVETELPVQEEPEPAYPPGPEGEIDQRADEEGWTYDSIYASASEYVQDMCVSLPDQSKNWSPAQWLAEGGYMEGDGEAILSFGVPKLCPKWTKTVKAAASGDYERYISGGDYEVKADPAPFDAGSGVQEIAPGMYQATGEFKDCYWERTSPSGDIIDNQFVTQARVLTVTLQAGELFRNDCGTFKPVG
jgi:hypothetical protein